MEFTVAADNFRGLLGSVAGEPPINNLQFYCLVFLIGLITLAFVFQSKALDDTCRAACRNQLGYVLVNYGCSCIYSRGVVPPSNVVFGNWSGNISEIGWFNGSG